jgi:hypothetical protein
MYIACSDDARGWVLTELPHTGKSQAPNTTPGIFRGPCLPPFRSFPNHLCVNWFTLDRSHE